MSKNWVISDTHFLHENMLNFEAKGRKFRGKDFKNQSECDQLMIDNWSSLVKPEDTVWHLGDVFIGNKEEFCNLWAKLPGIKRLIVGNHDDIRYLCGVNPVNGVKFFRSVDVWKKFPGIVMTHVPMQMDNAWEGRDGALNLHGHIHTNPSPSERHINMCVEVNDYKPVNIESFMP